MSEPGITPIANKGDLKGLMPLDSSHDNLNEVVMYVQFDRVKLITDQMYTLMSKIYHQNSNVKLVQNAVSVLRFASTDIKFAKKLKTDLAAKPIKDKYALAIKAFIANQEINPHEKFFDMGKINRALTAITGDKNDPRLISTIVNNIQSKLEILNSDSQLDMTKFQVLSNLRANGYTLVSNFMSKALRTSESIIGNIGR